MTRSKPFVLPRRTFLRAAVGGVTATLGLPVLECMLDTHGEALADGSPLPLRFVTWFFANGVFPDLFYPKQLGPGFDLSPCLAPFTNVRDYLTVLSGFDNREPSRLQHHEGMVIFSGHQNRDIQGGAGTFSNAGGPSIDQVIAAAPCMSGAPVASVQVGVSKRISHKDFGTTPHHLSHAGYLAPLPPERDPRALWSRLFASFDAATPEEIAVRVRVLDAVRGRLSKLRLRLGAADRQRMDAHTDAVSSLQKKLAAVPSTLPRPDQPNETNLDVDGQEPLSTVSDLMHGMLVYALRTGLTQVASMMFDSGAGETVFHELGQAEINHNISHDPELYETDYSDGVTYRMQFLADFCERLAAAEEGAGNLLDQTAIFVSSDCSTGADHAIQNQPMLILGKLGGALAPAAHHHGAGRNPSDVLLALRQVVEPGATQIGDALTGSTTPYEALKAPQP